MFMGFLAVSPFVFGPIIFGILELSDANYFIGKPVKFAAIEAIVRALHFCMSFNPPRLDPLARLPEDQPDPRVAHATA
jgi:hypothetical protein